MTETTQGAADLPPQPHAVPPLVPAGEPLQIAAEVAAAVLDAHPRGRSRHERWRRTAPLPPPNKDGGRGKGLPAGLAPKALRPETEEERKELYERLVQLLNETRTEDGVAAALNATPEQLASFIALHAGYQFRRQWAAEKKRLAHEAAGYHSPGKPGKGGGHRKIPAKFVPPGAKGFQWEQDKRDLLLAIYVDTGDLLKAQKEVGVTPSEFNAEVDANAVFSAALKAAERQARRTRQLIATSEALQGNDRLLAHIIKEGDDDNIARLSDSQLAQRLTGIISRIRSRIDPDGTGSADHGGEAGAPHDAGGSRAPAQSEQDCDDIP